MTKETTKYQGYHPPFTLSPTAVEMIADIAAQMEQFAIRMECSHKGESINVYACDTVN